MEADKVAVDAKKLKYLRYNVRRLTQGQLAQKSGVGQSHISRLERGERPNAHISTVAQLAEVLNVSVDELLAGRPSLPAYKNPKVNIALEWAEELTEEEMQGLIAAFEDVLRRKKEERFKG